MNRICFEHYALYSSLPVRNLLQRQLLVTLKKNRDVVPYHPNKKGNKDNGQHYPKSNIGVQQKLRLGH